MKEDRIDQRGDFYEKSGWRERQRERGGYPRAGEVLICSRKLLDSYVRSTVPEPCLPFLFRSTPPLVRPKANECPSTPKVLHWHRLWAWSSPRLSIMDAHVLFRAFSSTRFASEEVVDWNILSRSSSSGGKSVLGRL